MTLGTEAGANPGHHRLQQTQKGSHASSQVGRGPEVRRAQRSLARKDPRAAVDGSQHHRGSPPSPEHQAPRELAHLVRTQLQGHSEPMRGASVRKQSSPGERGTEPVPSGSLSQGNCGSFGCKTCSGGWSWCQPHRFHKLVGWREGGRGGGGETTCNLDYIIAAPLGLVLSEQSL